MISAEIKKTDSTKRLFFDYISFSISFLKDEGSPQVKR